MSWLSSLFHKAESWVSNVFNPKPPQELIDATNAQTEAVKQQTAQAKAAADAALAAQQQANDLAKAAAVPAQDSESARAASIADRKKRMAGSSFGIGLPTQLGAPPVGYRLLSGQ
jgi:hypothetical protein